MAKRGKTVAAMIKARGGSKGLPGKNIRTFCGKPLIAWAIETAKRCPSIDYVFVSTDSRDIAEIAGKYQADVPFIRPGYLATDTAHDGEVLFHAVDYLEREKGASFDLIVTLHPTSPLRRPEDIERALELITSLDCGSVASVSLSLKSPYWMYFLEGSNLRPFADDGVDYHNLERQQLPKTYQLNGIVYVTRVSEIKEKKIMITADAKGFEIEAERSISIDNINDFLLAEAAMKEMFGCGEKKETG